MATANSSRSARYRGRSGSNRPRTHPMSKSSGPPMGLQASVELAIEQERQRLLQASALRMCLELAANEITDDFCSKVDIADVANMIRELICRAHNELDSVSLARAVGEDN